MLARSRDEDRASTDASSLFRVHSRPRLSLRPKHERWVPRSRASVTPRFSHAAPMARLQQPFDCGPDDDSQTSATQPTYGHDLELPLLTLRPEPRLRPPLAARCSSCEASRAKREASIALPFDESDLTEAAPGLHQARTKTRRPGGFERRFLALWALRNPLLVPDPYTHCRDSIDSRGRKPARSERTTKTRVDAASREGNDTRTSQGAFRLRRVSFERSGSLPLARPRLIPFYAGACPSRSRCHCKRGTRAFATPADAWD